jgi:hypothetical protein
MNAGLEAVGASLGLLQNGIFVAISEELTWAFVEVKQTQTCVE